MFVKYKENVKMLKNNEKTCFIVYVDKNDKMEKTCW